MAARIILAMMTLLLSVPALAQSAGAGASTTSWANYFLSLPGIVTTTMVVFGTKVFLEYWKTRNRVSPAGWQVKGDTTSRNWWGADSIVNQRKRAIGSIGAPLVVFMPFVVVYGIVAFGNGEMAKGIFYIVLGAIPLFAAWKFFEISDWINPRWSLSADRGVLTYVGVGESSWSVALDQISGVETSLTREWQSTRRSAPFTFEVPEQEYQTYLVLHDTSRRVIYTATADREGTATLAHSVRSWLEQARSTAAPASRSAKPSSLGSEGFNL